MGIVTFIQALIFYGGLVATLILGFLSWLTGFTMMGIVAIVLLCLTGPCGVLIQQGKLRHVK